MEILNWKAGEELAGAGVYLPGKLVTPCAVDADPIPAAFQVYQLYSSAMRQILKYVGVPERRRLFAVRAEQTELGHWHAESEWRLPTPRGPRKSASFIFTVDDEEERQSPIVYSSRLGVASLSFGGEVGLQPGPLPIGTMGHGALASDIRFAMDPEVEVRILTGDHLVDHMMANLLEDVGYIEDNDEDQSLAARIEFGRDEILEILRYAYAPPPSWELIADADVVSGAPGEPGSVHLEISAPDPGDCYIAVEYRLTDDPEVAETTDAWALSVGPDLTVTANAYPEDIPLPALAFA